VTIAEVRRLVGRIPPYALATRFQRRPLRHIARFILISVYGAQRNGPNPGIWGRLRPPLLSEMPVWGEPAYIKLRNQSHVPATGLI
jgi:hypothetical protein